MSLQLNGTIKLIGEKQVFDFFCGFLVQQGSATVRSDMLYTCFTI